MTGPVLSVVREGGTLLVRQLDKLLLTAEETSGPMRVQLAENLAPAARMEAVQALLEQQFAQPDGPPTLFLAVSDPFLEDMFVRDFAATSETPGTWNVRAEQVFQDSRPWLPAPLRPAFPLRYTFTNGQRHPVRPAKPSGAVYSRWIPWLRGTFSLRTLAGDDDLHIVHRWLNDPRVDFFWDEAGTLDKHRSYLAALDADPHMLTLFGCIDGRPFSYFELYWARENRLGPYYDAADHDRGWHVVVGEDSCRGRAWVTTWLPSLMHYMFLDEPRTQRIVGEPRDDHTGQLRNLDLAGFARIKHVVLPHKRAVLVRLERERFFADRLWAPPQA